MSNFISYSSKTLLVFIIYLSFLYTGCQQVNNNSVTEKQAKTILDGYVKFRNTGDTLSAIKVFQPDCIVRYPNIPGPLHGLDALKRYDKATRKSFPDFKITIDDYFIKDNKIISKWTVNATNTGILGNLPPTNKKIHISGIAISKIVDGKIAEDDAYFNTLDMIGQLGFTVIPPQAQD